MLPADYDERVYCDLCGVIMPKPPDPQLPHWCAECTNEEVERVVGVHSYLSTGCLHKTHGACRRRCKFCGQPCRCPCHVAKDSAEEADRLRDEWEGRVDD